MGWRGGDGWGKVEGEGVKVGKGVEIDFPDAVGGVRGGTWVVLTVRGPEMAAWGTSGVNKVRAAMIRTRTAPTPARTAGQRWAGSDLRRAFLNRVTLSRRCSGWGLMARMMAWLVWAWTPGRRACGGWVLARAIIRPTLSGSSTSVRRV